MASISAIVVSWNTRALLEKCLLALQEASQGLDVDMWVVDNASSDGSPEMVREKFPSIHLIENRENIGFARANNQAARQSSGEYILLVNFGCFPRSGRPGSIRENHAGLPGYGRGWMPTTQRRSHAAALVLLISNPCNRTLADFMVGQGVSSKQSFWEILDDLLADGRFP